MSYAVPILAGRAVDTAFDRYETARAVGERIRSAREWAGIPQEELAEYAGMSASTLRRIESGERRLLGRERSAIARGLGVSLSYLGAA
jgi:transcriptional regulator with XRE-family HTH domain